MQNHLSQSLGVGAHVSQDNQDVFLTLVSHELCRGEGKAGSDDTLNAVPKHANLSSGEVVKATHLRWIVGNVQEETHVLHRAVLLKVLLEETSCLHVHLWVLSVRRIDKEKERGRGREKYIERE